MLSSNDWIMSQIFLNSLKNSVSMSEMCFALLTCSVLQRYSVTLKLDQVLKEELSEVLVDMFYYVLLSACKSSEISSCIQNARPCFVGTKSPWGQCDTVIDQRLNVC